MKAPVELLVDGKRVRVERDGDVFIVSVDGEAPTRVRLTAEERGRAARHASVNDRPYAFGHAARIRPEGTRRMLAVGGATFEFLVVDAKRALLEAVAPRSGGAGGKRMVKAPIPGLITEVKVAVGDVVSDGQTLIVLFAMKLENEIRAPHAGVVRVVKVSAGNSVEKGDLMVEVEEV